MIEIVRTQYLAKALVWRGVAEFMIFYFLVNIPAKALVWSGVAESIFYFFNG